MKKYKLYNPKDNTIIVPIRNDISDEDNKIIPNMKKIGIKVLNKIDMPFNLGYDYYYCKLPKSFELIKDENEEYVHSGKWFDFQDEKGYLRFRVSFSVIHMAFVYTRYCISNRWNELRVVDTQESDYFADFDGEKVIKSFKNKKGLHYDSKLAEKWLDKKYPNWRDPTAYWS